ncbi:MAG: hypothetical protein ACPKPY_12840 [Nitrososphaeraceae archaeon]
MQTYDIPNIQIQTMVTEYESDQINKIIEYMAAKNVVPNTLVERPRFTRRSFARQSLITFIEKWIQIMEDDEEYNPETK